MSPMGNNGLRIDKLRLLWKTDDTSKDLSRQYLGPLVLKKSYSFFNNLKKRNFRPIFLSMILLLFEGILKSFYPIYIVNANIYLNYGDYLYQLGLLDANERQVFTQVEQEGLKYMTSKQWKKAFDIFNTLLDGNGMNSSYFKNFTVFENYYNYLYSKQFDISSTYLATFIQRCDVRAAIHVGNTSFSLENLDVEKYLMKDVPQSVAMWISELLSHCAQNETLKPLFLTPLIEAGQIRLARQMAEVDHQEMTKTRSYSGYLTVNKHFNSNLFFWFFSNDEYKYEPVVLWLQGGPGASSLFGLFEENGPFVAKKHHIKLRKYSWTRTHSVLYIDNPVGIGYSFTNGGSARNETTVGKDLYQALLQFFTLFPKLQSNEFYITGESYGGKYVPAIAYTIYKNNPNASLKINLQGLAIGNGYSDPVNQFNYGDYLYQLGLLDANERQVFTQVEQEGLKYMKSKQWKKAFDIFNTLLDGNETNSSYFKNFTGFKNYYNYLYSKQFDISSTYLATFIQRCNVRAAIHVGNTSFSPENLDVEKYLMEDVPQSVAMWISELLSHYRVLIYNGQLDIIVAFPLTENYIANLNFSAANDYKNAKKKKWYVEDKLAGYVKTAGNLTLALVRNAGHMVPSDQPQFAFDFITRFTHHKSLP